MRVQVLGFGGMADSTKQDHLSAHVVYAHVVYAYVLCRNLTSQGNGQHTTKSRRQFLFLGYCRASGYDGYSLGDLRDVKWYWYFRV